MAGQRLRDREILECLWWSWRLHDRDAKDKFPECLWEALVARQRISEVFRMILEVA